MATEAIKVEGNFAVKLGKKWVSKSYSDWKLIDQPETLIGIKDAIKLIDDTGGELYEFEPKKVDGAELKNLRKTYELVQNDSRSSADF